MPRYQSWFRPWLDHPGPWDPWNLTAEEMDAVAALLPAAGAQARQRLRDLYGEQANRFGGLALVERLSTESLRADDLFRLALVLLAVDHYGARMAVPQPAAGGSTNQVNVDRWAALQPYLLERLRDHLSASAADSLVARAVLGSIGENWIPTAQIGRQLQQQIMASGFVASVEVALDLRLPNPGGGAWLRAETAKTLEATRVLLADRRPAVVEVLRDPMAPPTAAQILVVYHLETTQAGTKLTCYDPEAVATPCRLRVNLNDDDANFQESPANESRPSIKALRLIAPQPVAPDVLGASRWWHWLGGLWWYLKRRWLVFRHRRRDVD